MCIVRFGEADNAPLRRPFVFRVADRGVGGRIIGDPPTVGRVSKPGLRTLGRLQHCTVPSVLYQPVALNPSLVDCVLAGLLIRLVTQLLDLLATI